MWRKQNWGSSGIAGDLRGYIKLITTAIDPLRFGGFSLVISARAAPLTSSLIKLRWLKSVVVKFFMTIDLWMMSMCWITAMPRGVKRGPAEGESEVVVRVTASPAHTTLLEDSPQPISYHLLDHGYGATPQHQIRREAPSAPPKTSEVSSAPGQVGILNDFGELPSLSKFTNEPVFITIDLL